MKRFKGFVELKVKFDYDTMIKDDNAKKEIINLFPDALVYNLKNLLLEEIEDEGTVEVELIDSNVKFLEE